MQRLTCTSELLRASTAGTVFANGSERDDVKVTSVDDQGSRARSLFLTTKKRFSEPLWQTLANHNWNIRSHASAGENDTQASRVDPS